MDEDDFFPPADVAALRAGIGHLALALAKAQGEITTATKDSENPAYKRAEKSSKYADLASTWEACRAALSKNELAVIQTTHLVGDRWVLRTTLAHSSGETISGDFPLRPLKEDMQGFTGAVTYARRAGLAAISGVAAKGEDDDGNTASGVTGKTVDKTPPPQVVAKEPTRTGKPEPTPAQKAEAKKWADEAIAKLDPMKFVNAVRDWEVDEANEVAMRRLKANHTEQYNRVLSFIHQKLEALGALDDGARTPGE